MAYDESVALRVRQVMKKHKGVTEKNMFGGIAFMLNGNMCCGVINNNLVLRLGREEAAKALKEPHTSEMDFTGKPLKSMVYVRPSGYLSDNDLKSWISRAIDFGRTLPKKQGK